jgi:hypothetical protein
MGFAAHLYHRVPTGRRAAARLRLHLPGELVTLDGQGRAVIENLSRTGARIATRLTVRPGTTCVLRWHGCEALGVVRWQYNGHCGLAFDSPLSHDDLMAARWLDANIDRLERDHWQKWAQEFVTGTGQRSRKI